MEYARNAWLICPGLSIYLLHCRFVQMFQWSIYILGKKLGLHAQVLRVHTDEVCEASLKLEKRNESMSKAQGRECSRQERGHSGFL